MIKRYFLIAVVFAVVTLLATWVTKTGYFKPLSPEQIAERQQADAERLQAVANEERINFEARQAKARESGRRITGQIEYVKDVRTGFCFAVMWGGDHGGGPSLATVPCTPKVEELIQLGLSKNSGYY